MSHPLVVVRASSFADYDTKVWLGGGGGGQGGSSCHQAKWTVNIFTVRVISSLDLFQQGLPEGSIHWPPGMNRLLHKLKQSLLPSTGISKLNWKKPHVFSIMRAFLHRQVGQIAQGICWIHSFEKTL